MCYAAFFVTTFCHLTVDMNGILDRLRFLAGVPSFMAFCGMFLEYGDGYSCSVPLLMALPQPPR